MTQHARRGRKMASFMAGASVLALSVAGAGSAVAAPLLLGPGGSGGTVTVTAPTIYDFIVIDSYTVNGDVDQHPGEKGRTKRVRHHDHRGPD